MGYFDKSIDKHFDVNAEGKQVVYPWDKNLGYIIFDDKQYRDMRSAVKRKLIIEWWQPLCTGLIFFYMTFGHLKIYWLKESDTMLIAMILMVSLKPMAQALINYDFRRVSRRYSVASEMQIVVVSNKPSLSDLKRSLLVDFLCLIVGVVYLWQLSVDQDLFKVIIAIVTIIPLIFIFIDDIRSIMAIKANTSKKPPNNTQ